MRNLGEQMGMYGLESGRLSESFREITKANPFADFEIVRQMDSATRDWRNNTRQIEESNPVIISSRSHQALGQVNLAISRLIDSIKQSQSMSMSSGGGALDQYFKSLKKMLSDQQGLNQQTQKMKEQMQNQGQRIPAPDKPGEQSGQQPGQEEGDQGSPQEQLRKMARQQASIRRQLDEIQQKYGHLKEKTGNLEGIGDLMQEVEKELEHNKVNDQVTDLQQKIEQRLLDAEKSLHEKGYKRKRKALRAEGEGVLSEGETQGLPTGPDQPEELARMIHQRLDQVSPHWRERVRKYYDRLLQ
jgi:hypothetical protein